MVDKRKNILTFLVAATTRTQIMLKFTDREFETNYPSPYTQSFTGCNNMQRTLYCMNNQAKNTLIF